MEYVLQTRALSKQYGKVRALENLTLKVPKGAVYGLWGAEGAGKTTLLRLICGLQRATAGSYFLYGVENCRKELEVVRRRTGTMVGEEFLYPDLTAEENLRYQLLLRKGGGKQETEALMQAVGLFDRKKEKVRGFSVGMRKRLGMAMALAGEPEFLLLDEPFQGLEKHEVSEMQQLILRLHQKNAVTFLITGREAGELEGIATHLENLYQGMLGGRSHG